MYPVTVNQGTNENLINQKGACPLMLGVFQVFKPRKYLTGQKKPSVSYLGDQTEERSFMNLFTHTGGFSLRLPTTQRISAGTCKQPSVIFYLVLETNLRVLILTRGRSLRLKFHLARLDSTRLDTFDVSSPCILAVSSQSKSTARLARHVELDRRYLQLSYDHRNSFIV